MPINQGALVIAIGVLTALVLALGFILFDLRRKILALFPRGMPGSHAEMLTELLGRTDLAEREIQALAQKVIVLEKTAAMSFQKVGFMRFNPFSDTGGDQSFALALLDRENNGIVVSSLYNRDGTRVYAKAIDHGNPKQALSGEEEEVLKRAISKNKAA